MLSVAPKSLGELQTRLIDGRKRLTAKLKRVGWFVMRHPDEVAFDNIGVVSGRIGVSNSTIVRFAQTMELKGFTDLQSICRLHLSASRDFCRDGKSQDPPPIGRTMTLLRLSMTIASSGIDASVHDGTVRVIEEAVLLLERVETIFLVGRHKSYPIISVMNEVLTSLGVRNFIVPCAMGNDLDVASFASKKDGAIVVSLEPDRDAGVELAARIEAAGAAVVLLTGDRIWAARSGTAGGHLLAERFLASCESMSGFVTVAMTLALAIAHRHNKI